MVFTDCGTRCAVVATVCFRGSGSRYGDYGRGRLWSCRRCERNNRFWLGGRRLVAAIARTIIDGSANGASPIVGTVISTISGAWNDRSVADVTRDGSIGRRTLVLGGNRNLPLRRGRRGRGRRSVGRRSVRFWYSRIRWCRICCDRIAVVRLATVRIVTCLARIF